MQNFVKYGVTQGSILTISVYYTHKWFAILYREIKYWCLCWLFDIAML